MRKITKNLNKAAQIARNLSVLLLLLNGRAPAWGSTQVVRLNSIQPNDFPRVTCYISVLEADGASRTGLGPENFRLQENGEPISDFTLSAVALKEEKAALFIIVDGSRSMRGRPFAAAKRAVADFSRYLNQQDLLGIIPFSYPIAELPELTADHTVALKALDQISPKGKTAIYDTVLQAIEKLSEYPEERKAIVILTDGYDNASGATADECAQAARQNRIVIYGIGLGHYPALDARNLRKISEESEGEYFETDNPENLRRIYRDIARRISNQYVLTFISPLPAAEASRRRIQIFVQDGDYTGNGSGYYIAAEYPGENPGKASRGNYRQVLFGGIGLFLVLDLFLLITLGFRGRSLRSSKRIKL